MPRVGVSLTCFVALGCGGGRVMAGIAYDNITGHSGRVVFVSAEDEYADDTTLDPSQGMVISAVRARLYNASMTAYTGELRIRLYQDGGGVPGALLNARSTVITLGSRTEGTFEVAFPHIVAPGVNVWTGYQVQIVGGQAQVGILEEGYPTVGESSDLMARHYPDGTWGVASVPDANMLYQIVTMPGPVSAGVLGVCGIAWMSRRRRAAGR